MCEIDWSAVTLLLPEESLQHAGNELQYCFGVRVYVQTTPRYQRMRLCMELTPHRRCNPDASCHLYHVLMFQATKLFISSSLN